MTAWIRITDGVETIDIDNISYSLAGTDDGPGWAPAVSFDDTPVTETLAINIMSSDGTIATLQAAVEKLQRIMRNIRRFGRGQTFGASSRMEYAQDSAISTKPAALLVDALPLVLPANTTDLLLPGTAGSGNPSIDNVIVTITRRGTWIGASQSSNSTSGLTTQGAVMSCGFATSPTTPCPLFVYMGGIVGSETPIFKPGFLLIANLASKLAIANSLAAGPAQYTSVADAAAKASGNILHYTPTTTDETLTNTLALPGALLSAPNRVGVYASVRNNGTTAYRVRALITDVYGVGRYTEGWPIPAGAADPTWVYLGSVTSDIAPASYKLAVKASAAASTLDINCVAFIDLTDELTSRVLALTVADTHGFTTAFALQAGQSPTARLTPSVRLVDTNPNERGQSYAGDATLLSTGNSLAALWLTTYGIYWRHIDDNVGGDPITDAQLSATRRLATQAPG